MWMEILLLSELGTSASYVIAAGSFNFPYTKHKQNVCKITEGWLTSKLWYLVKHFALHAWFKDTIKNESMNSNTCIHDISVAMGIHIKSLLIVATSFRGYIRQERERIVRLRWKVLDYL